MPYPEELKKLIKVVESTRSERVERKKKNEEVPFMSLDERHDILKHHPDFIEEGRRELQVGPSKGYRIAHEMANVLEVSPETVILPVSCRTGEGIDEWIAWLERRIASAREKSAVTLPAR